MANWAWPHTPNSRLARIVLADGPADGDEVGFLPADTAAPAQIVWSGWLTHVGFTAYVYEWHGERVMDRGRTDAVVYRCTGRRLPPDAIPPLIAETAEVWADGADMIRSAFDVPADLLWPGV